MGLWSIIVGGVETNLDAYGFYVQAALGAGMPDPQLVTEEYAVLDGAQLQRTRIASRVLTLKGTLVASSLSDLHAKRKALIGAVRRDNADPQAPVTLKYTGGGVNPVFLDCYFEAGLSMTERRGFSEQLGLRFLATNPFWYGSTAQQALAVQASIPNVYAGWLRRSAAGAWASLQSLGTTYRLTRTPGGDVLAAQVFGSTVIRYPSGTTYATGGASPTLAIEGPDGSIYALGSFSGNIARWNGSAWTALGTGLNATARDMAIGADGALYVVGTFTTAGGVTVNRAARWNGSAWSALGSGLNGEAYAITVGLDGSIYVSGTFTTAGGVAADGIARWNGSAWSALGSGPNATILSLVTAPDGSIYAGGAFTTLAGLTLNRVARWNGLAWSALGSGLNGQCNRVTVGADGLLIAAGDFSSAGGIPMPDGLAIWNGTAWVAVNINLPATSTAQGAFLDARGELHLEYSGGGFFTATAGAVTLVTNAGSAAVAPTITVAAPAGGRLYQVINHSTGAALHFNLPMLNGETLTINCARRTVTSSYRGSLLRSLVPGSQLARFALLPGANNVSLYHATATATASVAWTNRYWSHDG